MSKTKLFIYIIFILIVVVSGWTVYHSRQKALDYFTYEYSNRINLSYQFALKGTGAIADIFYKQNEEAIGHFYNEYINADLSQRDAIRESMLDSYMSFYEDQKDLGLKQLHFHLANGESFIRFHRPDKYGDNLMDFRESVRLANTEKRYVTGFEEGRIFNGFRYVYPVFYNGEHLGSFEVSFDFDAIRRVMVDYTDSYIFLALRKDVVDKKVFADEKSNYKPCCINKDFVVARKDSLMSGVAERGHVNFEENLDHIRSHMKAMSEFSEIANAGEELIITHFLPIKNVKGEKVAYIIATSKGLEAPVLSYVFYLKIIGGAALLIVLLFLWNGKMDSLNCKLKIQTEELNKLAVLDGLTGVFNRRKSEIFVETEFDRVKRYKSTFSILMLDIDFFKEVNDKYGHSVGDSVLVEFCQVVQKNIRSVDILGRWGGEEFVIISPETDEEKAVIFANGIKDKIANHSFEHIGGLTVSIGLSSYSADDESYDQVLQRADEAMYKSKETGRNTVNRA